MKSTHRVEVVPIKLEKHPNADSLSLVRVFGYTVATRTDEWEKVPTLPDGSRLAAYLPPDSLVDVSRPEFAFLAKDAKEGFARIKTRKIRSMPSYGLLIPAPAGSEEGADLAEPLGVGHYEPPTEEEKAAAKKTLHLGGETAKGPTVYTGGYYDVESFQRYAQTVFVEGEPVIATEKLDGTNARYVWWDGEYHAKSRKNWKKRTADHSHVTLNYLMAQGVNEIRSQEILDRLHTQPKRAHGLWEVLEKTPGLEKFLRDNPGTVVFGEVYGNVNCIKYGLPDGNRFAAFDVMEEGVFLDWDQASYQLELSNIPHVPLLNNRIGYDLLEIDPTPYNFDSLMALAEGPTMVANAKEGVIREGIVVRPVKERFHEPIGRLQLKIVSVAYSEKYRK